MSRPPARILYIVTHPMTADVLLRGQLAHLRGEGFEVAVASAPGDRLRRVREREGVAVFPLPLVRDVAPLADLRGLLAAVRLLRRYRPTLVNASTPKAAFLGLVAARLAGVPHRVFLLRGLRSETLGGGARWVQRRTERACVRLATEPLAVGPSLADRARELGVAPEEGLRVLGEGSSNGVDVGRFRFDPGARARLRRRLGVADTDRVIGFVGRLTRDKGIEELLAAFRLLADRGSDAPPRLVLVGPVEDGDPVGDAVEEGIRSSDRVHHLPWVDDTAPWYSLFDVVAFPSYREGLPNVPLEAGCCERPVAGFAATGTVDVVRDGSTGRLVPPGDVEALAAALDEYLKDPRLCRAHGAAARESVSGRFARERVWAAWVELYRSLLRPGVDRASPAGDDRHPDPPAGEP